MAIRVGINGFGRIGRNVFRAGYGRKNIEFVAVNDITDTGTLAHLLKWDSILGPFEHEVRADGDMIHAGQPQRPSSHGEVWPADLPWKDLGVDIVVESTGLFTKGPTPRSTSPPVPARSSSRLQPNKKTSRSRSV
jgi:glyceraldehyde 3-phosphate dehydrogenase